MSEANLISAMESFGLIVDTPPRFDGRPVRYRMAGKRTRSGFMVGKEVGGKHYATFGTWTDRTLDQKWTDNDTGNPYCGEQLREISLHADLLRESTKQTAAKIAESMWNHASESSDDDHLYLIKKGVKSHGCRVLRNMLLVPYYNAEGQITTIQKILPDGTKILLNGGEISGSCFPIQGSDKKIFICEGFATGATIAELTGCKVLVSYSTSNILPVAQAARKKWPKSNIVLAADNDHKTEGNPGLKAAEVAAKEIGAEVVFPEFPAGSDGTDFNDLAAEWPAMATEILTGKISIISVPEIMKTEYKPLRWAVEKIIPEGLTVLAGRPKFGKSWLMLGLGYAVATGTKAWNFGKTTKGSVYYLALEDSPRRIKERIKAMDGYFDTYPENFFIFTEFPRIGQGFAERIKTLIDKDPCVGLIIIDTLQKIRPTSGGGNRNLYQAEYEDFESLQRLAISSGVPIVAIHHTRKQSTKGEPANPIDEISGSTGIQGVSDTLIACRRESYKGSMYVTGREVSETEYPMEFNNLNMTWSVSAPQEEIDVGPMILSNWFKTHDTIMAKEASEIFGVSLSTAKRTLKDLVEKGELSADVPINPKDPHVYRPTEIF